LKKQYEENMAKNTKRLITVLSDLVSDEDVPKRNEDESALYATLQDTFNAFDKDGCGELQYQEYVESWKFLGQPGGADEIKRSLNDVDVDGSG
jgi:Ca2+-binding EF-hand superfamily protein